MDKRPSPTKRIVQLGGLFSVDSVASVSTLPLPTVSRWNSTKPEAFDFLVNSINAMALLKKLHKEGRLSSDDLKQYPGLLEILENE